MTTFEGDTTQVRATAATLDSQANGVGAERGKLDGVRASLAVDLVGEAGKAAQKTLDDLNLACLNLEKAMHSIQQNLTTTAAKTDDQESQGSAGINAVAANSKVDTQSWA